MLLLRLQPLAARWAPSFGNPVDAVCFRPSTPWNPPSQPLPCLAPLFKVRPETFSTGKFPTTAAHQSLAIKYFAAQPAAEKLCLPTSLRQRPFISTKPLNPPLNIFIA